MKGRGGIFLCLFIWFKTLEGRGQTFTLSSVNFQYSKYIVVTLFIFPPFPSACEPTSFLSFKKITPLLSFEPNYALCFIVKCNGLIVLHIIGNLGLPGQFNLVWN